MAVEESLQFIINTTWDGEQVCHPDITLTLASEKNGNILLTVTAPFFEDPPPKESPGSLMGLWDYEVVELFLLGSEDRYLEIEVGPHGHYLVLLLNGERNIIEKCLPCDFKSEINSTRTAWTGYLSVPVAYLPKHCDKINAYAIHGTDDTRTYEALHPVTKGCFSEPNFHRLAYFKPVDIWSLITSRTKESDSEIWEMALRRPQ